MLRLHRSAALRAALESPRAQALSPLLGIGLFVGLLEGVAIVRYDVLMGDASPGRLAEGGAWLAAIVALHALAWGGLGWALSGVVSFDRARRLTFLAWAAAAALGRWLLDGYLLGLLLLAPLALLVLGVPRPPRGFLCSRGQRVGFGAVAALWTAGVGLAGWVPGAADPQPVAFWALTAGVALALLALGLAAPRWLAALGAAALAASAALAVATPRGSGPSVLMIVVDTLRRDHLSLYSDRVATPAIERLAAEGVRFEEAIAVVPKTPASVASLLTGRYPIHHGVRTLFDPLASAQETLAERFAERGYRTAALVDNPWLARGRGFEQGFERFRGYYELERPYGPLRYTSWVRLADRLSARRIRRFEGVVRASALTDAALAELAERGSGPFFLYVHYFAPHWPYLPPAALAARYGAGDPGASRVNDPDRHGIDRGRMIFQNELPAEDNQLARRLYRAEVDHTMAEVGRLIGGLDALGLRDSTIVALTADHGHSLGEHDYHYHHGSFLYDAELRVPLLLRWPGHLPEGEVVTQQVRTIDVAATLLELAGAGTPSDGDGTSLAPLWEGEARHPPEVFLESDVKMFRANERRERDGVPGKLRGLRTARHKLVLVPTAEGVRWELFDLERDPEEERNLAPLEEHRETLSGLKRRLWAWLPEAERAALEAAQGATAPAVDEAEQQLLRELGYAE